MLLLFDIDGTLLRGGAEAHRQALRHALRVVHGVDAALGGGSLPLAGRTDGDIARAALPAIARRRAGSPRRPYPREQTVVIGDTPRDVACARADGVRCVGVATGPYGVDELREADAVAPDIEALRAVLAEVVS